MHLITAIPKKTKTGTPITLDEAKKQVQIEPDFTADDSYIEMLVGIAIDKIENDTNSDVLETTNELLFVPENGFQSYTIPQAPLISVTKLEKRIGNTWSDVADTAYEVTAGFAKFELTLLENITADQFRLTYKTGYAAADIPKVLKGAALIKTADLFDSERQGYTLNVAANRAYESLISKHIRIYY